METVSLTDDTNTAGGIHLSMKTATASRGLAVVTDSHTWSLTLYGHIKTAEQRTIIQQYGDWYTGR